MITISEEQLRFIGVALLIIKGIGIVHVLYFVGKFGYMVNSSDRKYDFNNDPTEWLLYWWKFVIWAAVTALAWKAGP